MSASGSPHGYEYPLNGYDPIQDWDWSAASPTEPLEPANDTPNFFDNLLNPTIADDPAFAYTNASPYDMSSSRTQPGRLSNGYVDLTSPHVDLTTPDSPPRRRKRDSPSPGPSSKRQKREDQTAVEGSKPPAKIEEIDLSQDDDTVLEVLQKQREEAVKAQARPEETVTTFNTLTCVICMDKPTDLTATACGMFTRSQGLTKQHTDTRRSPLLPYVLDGGPHCRRATWQSRRTTQITMPCLSKDCQPQQGHRHHPPAAKERSGNPATEKA